MINDHQTECHYTLYLICFPFICLVLLFFFFFWQLCWPSSCCINSNWKQTSSHFRTGGSYQQSPSINNCLPHFERQLLVLNLFTMDLRNCKLQFKTRIIVSYISHIRQFFFSVCFVLSASASCVRECKIEVWFLIKHL